jgi:hypothetical protein
MLLIEHRHEISRGKIWSRLSNLILSHVNQVQVSLMLRLFLLILVGAVKVDDA